MGKIILAFLLMGLLPIGNTPPAYADRGGVVRFATLPEDGPGHPEGITADKKGLIFVATFDFTKPNVIYIFGRSGRLETTIPLTGAAPLGMAFDKDGNLYVANFGGGNLLKFASPFNSSSTPTAIPVCAGPPACGLNAIAFDAAGDLYVSDSFGGNIFKVSGGSAGLFVNDELLKPGSHGFPPFGANGLAFSKDGKSLFAANTADDRILKIDVGTSAVTAFAESVNGADGILFDEKGRLWVAANQADEIVALDEDGRVVDRRGSFEGIDNNGAVKGLLFPASIVLSRGSLFVTNAALALTGGPSEPEADVTTFTVSRIPLGGH
ncbi:MAG: SMP-30/gluconolactonase/LRE family protein [Candidatus Binatia bacterium]